MRRSARAHGKVILVGEHFVLPWEDADGVRHPGAPALVVPLVDRITEVELETAPESSYMALAPGLDFGEVRQPGLARALERAAGHWGWDLGKKPLALRVWSEIPVSRGFGSSAAFAVALSRAMSAVCGRPPGTEDLAAAARAVEDLFHGRSSGVDIAGAMHGDPLVFSQGEVEGHFELRAVDLLVVDSGPRDSSSTLVHRLLEYRLRQSAAWKALSARVERISRACREEIVRPGGAHGVAELVSECHELLRGLGLVTEPAREILRTGLRLGALAGKISGSGQGGALLLVCSPGSGARLAAALSSRGIRVLSRLAARESRSREVPLLQQ